MKKVWILLMLLPAVWSGTMAQNVVYGDNVQKRNVHGFHAIETSAGIEVVISKGEKEELAVSVGNNDYLPEIKTVVENGTLKISRTGDWKFWNQWKNWKVKVYVSYTELDGVKASSGGSVSGTDLKLDKLNAKLNSGANITLSGSVGDLMIDGSSGAQFRGYSLTAVNCHAETSSGAVIQVSAQKEISAKANSGGVVRFKGDALIRDINVHSGGTVKRQS